MVGVIREQKLRDGKLFAVTSGQQAFLANCEPVIEVSEEKKAMTLAGTNTKYNLVAYRAAIIICNEFDFHTEVDERFLQTVSSFSLSFRVYENGFPHERVFRGIVPMEIDLNGRWVFDATAYMKEIREMFPELMFMD